MNWPAPSFLALAVALQDPEPLPLPASAPSVQRQKIDQILAEMEKGAPTGTSEAESAARKAHYLEGRKKLLEIAETVPGTGERALCLYHSGTLALTAGEKGEAARDLERLLAEVPADANEAGLELRLLALEGLALAAPEKAEGLLRAAADQPGDAGTRARQALRRLIAERDIRVGGRAVPFQARGLQGELLSPEAFRGKVLAIHFWASWSAPSMRDMPALKELYLELHAKGFEVVGVSVDHRRIRAVPGGGESTGEGVEGLARFVRDFEMPWPQVYEGRAWDTEVVELYGIKTIPTIVLLDRKGTVRAVGSTHKEIGERARELVGERP
jgi:thiol-disulfide isomerase/thioredoxin